MSESHFLVEKFPTAWLLRLESEDGTNRLTRACVLSLSRTIRRLASEDRPLIIAGNHNFFSVGADLNEIASLNASTADEFSAMGQALMESIEHFPAAVFAAISGYCMGGGLDLALACHCRVASPRAIFGHRGAALGLITGWGGTQRLPRLVGKGVSLQMFVAAEKITAQHALQIGLIDAVAKDPVATVLDRIKRFSGMA